MNYKHINYGFINMMFAFQVEIPVHAQMKCGVLMFDNCTEQNEIKYFKLHYVCIKSLYGIMYVSFQFANSPIIKHKL